MFFYNFATHSIDNNKNIAINQYNSTIYKYEITIIENPTIQVSLNQFFKNRFYTFQLMIIDMKTHKKVEVQTRFIIKKHYVPHITVMILALCMLLSLPANAQFDIVGRKITSENGLPNNNIRCIAQDDDGYLWLGSLYGLYRYDGYRYICYARTANYNGEILPNNQIESIKNIGNGKLLIRCSGWQFVIFNTRTYQFEACSIEQANAMMPQPIGLNQFLDNYGNKVSYEPKTGKIHYIQTGKQSKSFSLKVVSDSMIQLHKDYKINVITTPEETVWISTNGNGIFIYNLETKESKHFTLENSPSFMTSNFVVGMTMTKDGAIWLAFNRSGIAKLKSEKIKCQVINMGLPEDLVNSNEVKILSKLYDGRVLVANDGGKIYTLTDSIILSKPENTFPEGLEYLTTGATPENIVWIGTRNDGLLLDGKFYRHHKSDNKTIGSNRISMAIYDHANRIWLGGNDNFFDLAIPSLNKNRRNAYTFRHFFKEMPSFNVRSMMTDHLNNIWVATTIGVITFNPDSLIVNPQSYKTYPVGGKFMDDNRINSIIEDRQNRIWIGTASEGLFYTENTVNTYRNGHIFHHIENNQLANNKIQVLANDSRNNIWIGTENGLYYYRQGYESIACLKFEGSHLRNIYQSNCATELNNGSMAFGTCDGIVIVNEKDMLEQNENSSLIISDIEVNGNTIFHKLTSGEIGIRWNQVSKLQLKYYEDSFSIYYSDLSYNNTTRYSYILEGYDRQWNVNDNLNFASYRNLSPGNYVFKVRATTPSGQITEHTININIATPWYATWWFQLLVFITVIIIANIIYCNRQRILTIRKQAQAEKMSTEYRLKFFTNISHEFRTPLTLIRVSMDKLLGSGNIPESLLPSTNIMQRNVERMSRLIDQLMEFRRMENNRLELRLEKTDVVPFLHNIWQTFCDRAESRNINYKFICSAKHCEVYIDRGYVDKILYNLLSNAFKYTPVAGEIAINIKTTEEHLVVKVIDNGIGVPQEKRNDLFKRFNHSMMNGDSMGIGLNLTAELVQTHHGTITFYDTEKQPSGATFVLKLPLDKSAYKPEEFMYQSPVSKNKDIEEKQSVTVNTTPLNEYTVLIVEDDHDTQDFLAVELGNYFHVRTASNGEEAIEILNDQLPDFVITDYIMPHLDGIGLLKHIRHSDYKHLPVIMLTAADSIEERIKGISSGADSYIAKPFSTRELIAQCVNILQRHEQLKVSYSQVEAERKAKIPELIVEERDREFITELNVYISEHLNETDLNVDRLAKAMGYGRTKFYQKVNAIAGCSPKEYIRKTRIEKAAELLGNDNITVAEVSYMVGFGTPQYLTTVFKSYYGISPIQYKQKGNNIE